MRKYTQSAFLLHSRQIKCNSAYKLYLKFACTQLSPFLAQPPGKKIRPTVGLN